MGRPGKQPEALRAAGMALLILLVLISVTPFYQSYAFFHPQRRTSAVTPSYFAEDYEHVVFSSSDGVELDGWLMPNDASNALVVVCHGHGSSKGDVIGVAEMLYRNGYSVFMFDFRAHGESGGDLATLGWLEVEDLKAAIGFVNEMANPASIGVLGFSMGGATAITTAGQTDDIKAVVADSAFADRSRLIAKAVDNNLPPPFSFLTLLFARARGMNLDDNLPISYVQGISPNALLIIQGDSDHLVGLDDARLLYDMAEEPKELWLLDDTPHVAAFHTERTEYERRVIGFFDEHLKGV
ncbi:MAG: alpha/beta hydrolase [Candidatus Aenigmarchaeota archaeon]|nr:alpha/beta hydrolase [Candidatus Aenigmarchaeota archaeon]